ncbi:hypothetical protein [Natronomonas moolapensis]|nr:hypothetical protein [Natronomonas moolapensis]
MIFGFGEDDDAESTDEANNDTPEGTEADAGAVDTDDGDGTDDAESDAREPSEDEPDDDSATEPGLGGDADGSPDADTDASDVKPDDGDGDDEDVDPESISTIDRIVLDPEELVQAVAYNGQEDIGQKSKAVYSLRPPFAPTVRPGMKHLEEHSVEGKADDEIHLRPFRFVVEGRAVIEQRPTRQLAREEMDADDPTDAAIEAWIDEAMEAWKGHVRGNLAESVDIFSPHGMTIVDVEYEPEPEAEAEPDSDSDPGALE